MISVHITEPNINILVDDKQYTFNINDELLIDKFIKFFGSTIAFYINDNLIKDYYPVILVFSKNNLVVFSYNNDEQVEISIIEDLKEIKIDTSITDLTDEILDAYKVDYNEYLRNSIQHFIDENYEITKNVI